MALTYIGGINGSQFCNLLSLVENRLGYIYKDASINAFTVHYGDKKNPAVEQQLTPLSFWEIVHFSRSYKRDFSNNPPQALFIAKLIDSVCNKQMQKQRSKSYLSQLCYTIADLATNFFSGYGFESTYNLGKQLSQELYHLQPSETSCLNAIVSKPISHKPSLAEGENISPTNITINCQSHSPKKDVANEKSSLPTLSMKSTIKAVQGSNQQTSSDSITRSDSGRTAMIRNRFASEPPKIQPFVPTGRRNSESQDPFEAYKQNKETLIQKQMIFMNIKYVNGLTKSSLEGLIKSLCNTKEIDFKNSLCIKIILDVFNMCTAETCEQTLNWLKTQDSSELLLKKCLEVLTAKGNSDQKINTYTLLGLLICFKQAIEKSETLTLKDPAFISAMTLLLKREPNDDKTIALLTTLLVDDILQEAALEWLKVFEARDKIHSDAKNLAYPAKDKLLEFLKQNSAQQNI